MTGRELCETLDRNGHLDLEILLAPKKYVSVLGTNDVAAVADPYIRYPIDEICLLGDLDQERGKRHDYVILTFDDRPIQETSELDS